IEVHRAGMCGIAQRAVGAAVEVAADTARGGHVECARAGVGEVLESRPGVRAVVAGGRRSEVVGLIQASNEFRSAWAAADVRNPCHRTAYTGKRGASEIERHRPG